MDLSDFYVLVDTDRKIIIDKIQLLPENWNNIAGLSSLSNDELCDLAWAGHRGRGWVSIASDQIRRYSSPAENLELNKNMLKQLISLIRKEKEERGIEYQGMNVSGDERTRYSLMIKKIQGADQVNFKCSNHYLTLTSSQINELLDMLEAHVQEQFDWEMKVYLQIEKSTKLSDFMGIQL